jgi:hypothetical protein
MVEVETGHYVGTSTCYRDQSQQLESLGTVIEDGPLGDSVTDAAYPHLAAAGVLPVAKTHLQEVHEPPESGETILFDGPQFASKRVPGTN